MSRIHQALLRAEQTGRLASPVAGSPPPPARDHAAAAASGETSVDRSPRASGALRLPTLTAPTLVVHERVTPTVLEQYRRLSAAIHHAQLERGVKTLMIVSAVSAEGKTLTAANVALTLSGSYRRRVLLIDGDLRRPTLHELFGVRNSPGWRETLMGSIDAAQHWQRVTPTLSLLTAGPHVNMDPIQALTGGRLASSLHRAAAEFDWIVLDTPPAALLPDVNLMASHVEAAVLVVRAGVTPAPVIRRAIEAVGRERLLGVALNRVEDRLLSDSHYGRYYYRAIEQRP